MVNCPAASLAAGATASTRPTTIPIPRQAMHKFLEVAADWLPKQTATIFYGSQLTYLQLERMVNQFAHALHGLGVRPGERVMLILPNMPQMIIAYYAILKLGGVVVLPNPAIDAPGVMQEIGETGAHILVTLSEFAQPGQASSASQSDVTVITGDTSQCSLGHEPTVSSSLAGRRLVCVKARTMALRGHTRDGPLDDGCLMGSAPCRSGSQRSGRDPLHQRNDG